MFSAFSIRFRPVDNDGCPEDKGEDYQNCVVLRTTVVHSDTRMHMSSS